MSDITTKKKKTARTATVYQTEVTDYSLPAL